MKALLLALAIAMLPVTLLAQRTKPKKDSLSEIKMVCPLLDAEEKVEEKSNLDLGTRDLKLVLTSKTDTIVKAVADGVVSTIQRDEDGSWQIIFFHDDYWFWLSGVTRATVRKNERIKAGQPIGVLTQGAAIELLLFDFETPVDPKTYLDCGKKAN